MTDSCRKGQPPEEGLLECLRILCRDKRNHVTIVSGRDQATLEEWFGGVQDLALCAEHGYHYKLPKLGDEDQWFCLLQQVDSTWKAITFEIMTQYMKRTQGSFIDNKGNALVWLFRDTDPDFGAWQAKELSQTLQDILFGFPIEVSSGKGYVEVKLTGVNKGQAISNILTKVQRLRGDVDFVLCVGDDRTDEDMFDVINHFSANKNDDDILSSTDCGDCQEAENSSDDVNNNIINTWPKSQSEDIRAVLLKNRASSSGMLKRPSARDARITPSTPGTPQQQHGSSLAVSQMARNSNTVGPSTSTSFNNLASLGGNQGASAHIRRYMTCTVGRKPTHARFYVDDVEDVNDILVALKVSLAKKKQPWGNADTMPALSYTSRPGVADIFPDVNF